VRSGTRPSWPRIGLLTSGIRSRRLTASEPAAAALGPVSSSGLSAREGQVHLGEVADLATCSHCARSTVATSFVKPSRQGDRLNAWEATGSRNIIKMSTRMRGTVSALLHTFAWHDTCSEEPV
jgi:hypothetical protein